MNDIKDKEAALEKEADEAQGKINITEKKQEESAAKMRAVEEKYVLRALFFSFEVL